ncbi:MAG: hypothetical protein IT207_05475 [Fimbriimonadaceae bacterium]|nr:hypothetical protein [Fimbriimonadaceae bacterium]
MIRPLLVPAAITVALSLVGCGGSKGKSQAGTAGPTPVKTTEVAAGQEKSLIPLAKGNTWVFEVDASVQGPGGNQQNKTEATFRVVKVEDKPDGQYAYVDIFNEKDVKIESIVWRLNEKGLFELSDVRFKDGNDKVPVIPNSPPLPSILFPIVAEKESKLTVTGLRPDGSKGPANVKVWNEGMQEIDTEIGRFTALAVTAETNYTSKNMTYAFGKKTWWVPDVGLARMVMSLTVTAPDGRQLRQSSTLRLKSKSP